MCSSLTLCFRAASFQNISQSEGSFRDAFTAAGARVPQKGYPPIGSSLDSSSPHVSNVPPSFPSPPSRAASSSSQLMTTMLSRKRNAFHPNSVVISASATRASSSSTGAEWELPPNVVPNRYPGLRVQIPPASPIHHHHHHHDDEHASKRPRRAEPSSPTSVGDIDDPKAIPRCVHTTMAEPPAALQQPIVLPVAPAQVPVVRAAPPAPSVASAKMQSVIRGLQHVSECASGCSNPLCVSTRNFIAKVVGHMTAMSQKAAHDSTKCGACQLWTGIVTSHAQTCKTVSCNVPLCSQRK